MKSKAPRLVVALVAVVSLVGTGRPRRRRCPRQAGAQRLVLLTAPDGA